MIAPRQLIRHKHTALHLVLKGMYVTIAISIDHVHKVSYSLHKR